jgi:hypothetical protein
VGKMQAPIIKLLRIKKKVEEIKYNQI